MKRKVIPSLILIILLQLSIMVNFTEFYPLDNNNYLYKSQDHLKNSLQPDILFVYTDTLLDWSSSITNALDNLGVEYDSLTSAPDYNTLKDYKVVIWSTGYLDANTASYEVRLEQFLNNGGNLLLTSNTWTYYADLMGNTTFINQYLGVNNYNLPTPALYTYNNIVGNNSDPIGQGLSFDHTSFCGLSQWIQPTSFASMVFYDSDNSSDLINATAISNNNIANGYKTVFFCMPLEHCGSLTIRTTILNRSLQWFMSNLGPPTLTNGQVTPTIGNTTQLFTFRVNYTDFDNNSPLYVNVTLNNTFSYEMQKENPIDYDYTDGVIYNFSTYLSAGMYNYTFNSSDWYFKVNSSTYTGPNVTSVNLNPPNLTNGNVDPAIGTEFTNFRFFVNYSDQDNNPPIYVNVTIDSQTFNMSKENPIDLNYIDGVIYEYFTTLTIGNHYFYFNASDGVNEVGLPNIGNYSGPQVNAYVPAPSVLFNGLSYNWSGDFIGTPWSGTEYYEYLGGNSFRCNESITDFGGTNNYTRTVDNRSRTITSTTGGSPWQVNSDDWLWIYNNVSLGEKVNISGHTSGNREFNVSGETTKNALGLILDVWILDHPDGDIAYYDKITGLLIEGTFIYLAPFTYFIQVTETNAINAPNFNIISPENQSYYQSTVPVIVDNTTEISNMWFRNSTDGIIWSNNYTLTYNGTFFTNSSNLDWTDGSYIIQVFGNNSFDLTQKSENFTVDTYGPYVVLESPTNNTYLHRELDIVLSNYSKVDQAWLRYNSGGGWSANFSLMYNGTHFVNNSISWTDGIYHLQVFANESTTEVALREEWFVIGATPPLNISHNLADDQRPRIALDSEGNVHIVWYGNETGVYEIYYDNNKNGYLGNKQQVTTSTTDQMWVDIAIDAFNIVHLVWMDFGSFDIYYTNNTGGQFNTPVLIPGGPYNLFPTIAVDSSGAAYVAWWATDGFIWGLGCDNNSAGSFGSPEAISPNLAVSNVIQPAMAIDDTNTIHVVYGYGNSSHTQLTYENNSIGDFSTNGVNISQYNALNENPDLALDSTGKVHITWSSNITQDNEIYYINNTMNDFTSEPLNVSKDPTSNDHYSAIALDTLSDPNSVFITWSKDVSEIYESNNYFGSFSTPQDISRSYTADYGPDIAIDSDEEETHFVWQGSGSDWDIYYDSYYYNPLTLLFPANITYDYQELPIIVQNKSFIDKVWCRNNTGSGWSANYTLTWNGTLFSNNSLLIWDDENYHLQIFGNDSANTIFMKEIYFQVDTMDPTISITYPTNGQDVSANIFWVNGTANGTGSNIASVMINDSRFALNQNPTGSLSGNFSFYNNSYIPDGIITILVNVTDNAGLNTLDTVWFNIDNTNPSISITYPTNGQVVTGNNIWINGTANGTGSNIASVMINDSRFIIDQNPVGSLSGNFSFYNNSYLPDGIIAIRVNITDTVGLTILDTVWFNIDNTNPTIFITYPINGQDIAGNTLWVNGTANGTGSNIVSVMINDSRFVIDQNPSGSLFGIFSFYNNSYIPDGIIAIQVNITDIVGFNALDTIWFNIDNTYPTISITYPTNGQLTTGSNFWINGTVNGTGSNIASVMINDSRFLIDQNPTGSLSGNFSFYNNSYIPDGIIAIRVNVTDSAGLTISDVVWFNIDNDNPTINIISPTNGQVVTGNNFWVNGTANGTGSNIVSLMINDSRFVIDQNPAGSLSGDFSFYNNSYIPEGIMAIRVNITDTIGLTAFDIVWFNIDNSNPTISITYPVNGQLITGSNFWVNGTANGTGSNIVSVMINDSRFVINQNPAGSLSGNFSFYNNSYLLDGIISIRVNISDSAGLTAIDIVWFNIDNTNPTISITYPTNGQDVANNTFWVNGTASGTGSNIVSVMINDSRFVIDQNPAGSLSGTFSFYNNSYLPDGIIAIRVNITDTVGLTSLDTVWFNIDNTNPTISITYPTNGQVVTGSIFWVNGTANGTGSNIASVMINDSRFLIDQNPMGSLSGNFSFYNNSYLPDGVVSIRINITDTSGLSLLDTVWFNIDNTNPTISITYPANGQDIVGSIFWVNGTGNGTGSNIASVMINDSRFSIDQNPVGSLSGSFSFYNNSYLPDGIIAIRVNITDTVGLTSLDTIWFNIDNTNPTISITYPTNGQVVTGSNFWVNGTANGTGSNIASVIINDSRFSIDQNPVGSIFGSFSFYNNSYLPDGIIAIRVNITDTVGLTSLDTIWFNIDNTNPTISITYPTNGQVVTGSNFWVNGTANGTGSNIASVIINDSRFSIDQNPVGSIFGSFSFYNNSYLPDGIIAIRVNITDTVGLTSLDTIWFNIDNTNPMISITYPSNGQLTTGSNFWVNGTANGTGSNITTLMINDSRFIIDQNPVGSLSGIFSFYNNSYLPDGIIPITVNVTDTAGMTTLDTVWFNIDNTNPTITITHPFPDGTTDFGSIVTVEGWVDGTGSNIQSVMINDSRFTISLNPSGNPSGPYFFSNNSFISLGYIAVEVNVTDWANLTSSTIRWFTYIIGPSINIDHPGINGEIDTGVNITINGTANGGGANIDTVWINDSRFSLTIDPSGTPFGAFGFENVSFIPDGRIAINVSINNTGGISYSLVRWFIIDNSYPIISISYPISDGDVITGSIIWINGSANGTGSNIASVMINDSRFVIYQNPTGFASGNYSFYNNSYLPDGIIVIRVNMTDSAGLTTSDSIWFNIDNSNPTISITYPTNGQVIASNTFWVNGTANGTGSNIVSVIINDSRFVIDQNPTGSLSGNFSFYNNSYIPDGIIAIEVNITDTVGFTSLDIVWFNIDNSNPNITIIYPTNGQDIASNIFWINGTANGTGTNIASVMINDSRFVINLNPTGSQSGNYSFYNNSYLPDGNITIRVNVTDSAGLTTADFVWFNIDNTAPELLEQDSATNYTIYQTGPNIWVNGSAIDLGSGLKSIEIINNNASCSWTVNLNTNQSWAFRNSTPISSDGIYEIWINATDIVGNFNITRCLISVEIGPPIGAPGAYLSNPQNGTLIGLNLYIWLNGTALDLGSGLFNVYIYPNEGNSSASWSTNQNTNESWAFYNTTPIIDNILGQVYEIKLNISDIAGNYFNLTFYFRVDTIRPSNVTNLCDLNISLTDNVVNLNWTFSTDNSPVQYEIWRRTSSSGWQIINITNFNIYQYNDTGLADEVYEYRIRPIDEAGNYGNFTNSIFVTIKTKTKAEVPLVFLPPQEDSTWILLLIIGIVAGVIAAVIIAKKRKEEEVFFPKITPKQQKPTAETKKAEFKLEIPPPKVPKYEEKVQKVGERKEILYYHCPNCKQIFSASEIADYSCQKCQIPLKLHKRVVTEDLKKTTPSTEVIYYCEHCNRYFKVPIKGSYQCPICNNILKLYQS